VASRRGAPDRPILRFEGFESIEEAETLAGGELSVAFDPSDAAAGEYYANQLQGLAVRTLAGEAVGRVRDVAFLPGRAFLEVEREGREATLLVPFHSDIVKSVDLARGQVTIDPPAGLLEI
jgi:16S rRNA processing protein RimM